MSLILAKLAKPSESATADELNIDLNARTDS